MEQSSKLDDTAPSPSERFIGRASGTRRIVKAERAAPASEAPTLVPAAPEPPRRWLVQALEAGGQLDTRWRGRLLWGSGALAATSGAAVPLLTSGGAALSSIRAASWLSLAALSFAGFLRAAHCRPKLGPWALAGAREQLVDSLRSSLRDLLALAHAPKNLRLSLLSRLARVSGFAGLGLSSVLVCLDSSLGRLAPMLSGACLWGASSLFASQLLSLALRLQTQAARVEPSELELALREFSPVVDLSAPQELESVFLDPTPLHEVMAGLSSWRDSAGWRTEQGCALAFQRQLAAGVPQARLELGRWLGESGAGGRADLVVDDCVLVDFQIGLQREDVPRVIERLRSYRRAWGERPIVLVVLPGAGATAVGSESIEALKAPGDAPRWIVAVAR